MNASPPTVHREDGLEWLRGVRRRLMTEAGGDLKSLGDKYRQSHAQHPEKVFAPRKLLTEAVLHLK
ncbi:MAG: hypothetical protein ACKVY0_19340 [Prosthecobacter sp.]|uniref:hypothetical protein n=1 Tax=Prosthecobacter sp. TaxID=1965333 RepID=UPI0039005ABD